MSEPTPPPETPAPEISSAPAPVAPAPVKAVRRKCNWHRVRVYTLGILIVLAMWFTGVVMELRLEPLKMINRMLAQLPYPGSAGAAQWVNRRTLKVQYVKIGDFFYADTIVITASPFRLARHHLAQVQLYGAQLYTKQLAAVLEHKAPVQSEQRNWFSKIFDETLSLITGYGDDGLDWIIGRLEINRATIFLNNVIQDVQIPIGLGVRHPVVLTGLHLGRPDSSPEMSQPHTVEISSVNITSPFDPLSPVFSFPLTKVTFAYTEIWHHHIRRIDMIHPTMFLGQDLFWLTDQLKSEKPKPKEGVEAPWYVGEFKVDYGRLAVNVFGEPVVHFPFFIQTKVDDIRLDQLDQASIKSSVNIVNLTQDYPEYKVRINNLSGKLYFSWPPSNAHANNVVNQIHVDQVSWNDIPAKDVYTTVTFDPQGIYGRLTGTCENGQLAGNFEFYYSKGFTWNADFFAQKVNCQPIAEKLVGRYCNLTGELDGSIAVQGKATEILDCHGLLQLPNPGVLQIKSMEELLNRLPPSMLGMERQAIKLAIDSFDTYPYDSGKLTLHYSPQGGASQLWLDGPRGSRNFQVVLHPYSLSADAPKEKKTGSLTQ
jgi:hypothetical protein